MARTSCVLACLLALAALAAAQDMPPLSVHKLEEDTSVPGVQRGTYALVGQNGEVVGVMHRLSVDLGRRGGPFAAGLQPASDGPADDHHQQPGFWGRLWARMRAGCHGHRRRREAPAVAEEELPPASMLMLGGVPSLEAMHKEMSERMAAALDLWDADAPEYPAAGEGDPANAMGAMLLRGAPLIGRQPGGEAPEEGGAAGWMQRMHERMMGGGSGEEHAHHHHMHGKHMHGKHHEEEAWEAEEAEEEGHHHKHHHKEHSHKHWAEHGRRHWEEAHGAAAQQLLPGVGTPMGLLKPRCNRGRWVELQDAAEPAPAPEGPSWALWGPDGGLNLGLVAFVALAVACVAVWAAMVGQWTAYRCARANNRAAEYLRERVEAAAAGEGGKASSAADLKPLLHEGPVKGAIAVVDEQQ